MSGWACIRLPSSNCWPKGKTYSGGQIVIQVFICLFLLLFFPIMQSNSQVVKADTQQNTGI